LELITVHALEFVKDEEVVEGLEVAFELVEVDAEADPMLVVWGRWTLFEE